MSLNAKYTDRLMQHPVREQVRVAVASKVASTDRQDWLFEVALLGTVAVLAMSLFSATF